MKVDEKLLNFYGKLKEGIVIKNSNGEILYNNESYSNELKLLSSEECTFNGEKCTLETYECNDKELKQLRQAFEKDGLTGLYTSNKLSFEIQKYLKSHRNDTLSFVKFSVDKFRFINSSTSRNYVNDILVEIANYFLKHKKIFPIAGRNNYSDDFYLLFKGNAQECVVAVEDFINKVSSKYIEISTQSSYGVYEIVDHDFRYIELEDRANYALKIAYQSKTQHYEIYDDKKAEKYKYEQELLNDFPRALEHKEFKLYIQPKYDLKSGTFFGGEVLSRWYRKGELVFPLAYIPVLEETGLISALDTYMLHETLSLIRKWINMGINPIPLSINFSRIDFENKDLFSNFLSLVDSYGVPHELIEPEITESSYEEKQFEIENFIRDCKNHGFNCLMDDFGNGYSSLSSLKDLDVSGIKVDYNFLKKAKIPSRREKILQSSIELGQSLGIKVIMEGIEDAYDVVMLREFGVRYAQGIYFSKPIPAGEFEDLNIAKIDVETDIYNSTELYDDIIRPTSPTNTLFDFSLVKSGVFKVTENKMVPVIVNKEFRSSSPLLSTGKELGEINLFDYIHPKDEKRIKQYFNNIINGVKEDTYIDYRYIVNSVERHERAKIMLLAKYDGYSLVFATANDVTDENFNRLVLDDFKQLFDELTAFGICAVDENGTVRYFNKAMLDIVKKLRVGKMSPIINTHGDLLSEVMTPDKESLFFPFTNVSTRVRVTNINVQGQVWKLGMFLFDNDDDSAQFKFSSNINYLSSIIKIYTEINLTDNTFIQARFDIRSLDSYKEAGDYEKSLLDYKDAIDVFDRDKTYSAMRISNLLTRLRVNQHLKLSYKLEGKNMWLGNMYSYYKGKDGKEYAIVYSWDETELALKNVDDLTSLLIRSKGISEVNEFISYNPNGRFAFVIFDIDHFKQINDTFGHPVGDRVLSQVGREIYNLNSEKVPVKMRLGGDELIVLVDKVSSKEEAVEYVNGITSQITESLSKQNKEFEVKLTGGVSLYPLDGISFKTLYRKADVDLYKNKAGKGR